MAAAEIKSEGFDEFVTGNAILDFWAPWCGPCKIMAPSIEAASEKLKDVKIGKVNVDEESELAQKFGVMSIPTLIFFKNGKEVDRTSGALPEKEIISRAEKSFG